MNLSRRLFQCRNYYIKKHRNKIILFSIFFFRFIVKGATVSVRRKGVRTRLRRALIGKARLRIKIRTRETGEKKRKKRKKKEKNARPSHRHPAKPPRRQDRPPCRPGYTFLPINWRDGAGAPAPFP